MFKYLLWLREQEGGRNNLERNFQLGLWAARHSPVSMWSTASLPLTAASSKRLVKGTRGQGTTVTPQVSEVLKTVSAESASWMDGASPKN